MHSFLNSVSYGYLRRNGYLGATGVGGFRRRGVPFDRGWGPASVGTGGPSLDQMIKEFAFDRGWGPGPVGSGGPSLDQMMKKN